MMTTAIIGQTPEVYYIDKRILDFIGYSYINDDEILIATGWRYFMKITFDNVIINDYKFEWDCGGVIPTTNITKKQFEDTVFIHNITPYQKDIMYKIIDGSYFGSVSHYKISKETYLKITREKKLKRIINEKIF